MSPDPSPPSRRAQHLGKYQILDHVATGGMGAVYRARDTELGREVALKVMQPEVATKPHLLERFRREARHAARLRHENIVTIYEYGEFRGTHFLALEYVDGHDLGAYVDQRGRLEPDEAHEIAVQAARALGHAHKFGVVHRDIKPSNFLMTHVDGKMVVKLADFGLARTEGDDDFRVTRDGSTVGTVDYIAPEQARDSRAADTRSDIYSLGCTLYHLLTGQAPFPDGGLGERLMKHMEAPPPNVRDLNPRVSRRLARILRKMLAKKPEQRFQTPAELLAALERVDAVTSAALPEDPLPDFLDRLPTEPGKGDVAPRPRKRASSGDQPAPTISPAAEENRPAASPPRPEPKPLPRAVPRPPRSTQETSEQISSKTTGNIPTGRPRAKPSDRQPPVPWVLVGVLAGLLVLGGGVGVLTLVTTKAKRQPRTEPNVVEGPQTNVGETRPGTVRDTRPTAPEVAIPKSPWPYLYRAAQFIEAEPLRRQATAPWANPPAAETPPILRLTRTARGEANTFDSLTTAFAAAPEGGVTAIEIRDNGPIFLTPAAAAGRSIILRAGKGYRPLLVWDVGATKADPARPQTLLAVSGGSLTLEGIDLALEGFEAVQPPALLRVTDGDLTATDCTFSLGGRQRVGVAVAALHRTDPKRVTRCRLTRCVGRGTDLIALDLPATGVEALVEGSLFAGGEPPLIQVSPRGGADETPTNLRLVRSTLVAGNTLLEARLPESPGKVLRCLAWDALLARPGAQSGGEMLSLPEGGTARLEWLAVNSLYAGWKTLLGGPEPVAGIDGWRRLWAPGEADAVESQTWPAAVPDLADALPTSYRPEGAVAFTATSGKGVLGCDLERLPPVRDGWRAVTVQRFVGTLPDLPAAPPEIPALNDGNYHGERLDLDRVGDLGAYLRGVLRDQTPGPLVVLYLTGSGEKQTSPFRAKGSSLVLVFEPPSDPKSQRLTLLAPGNAAGQGGLVEVEDGDLEVYGGAIRYEDFPSALLPPYLLSARGGSMKLTGCRLEGPTKQPSESFRGLVHVEGSGKGGRDAVRSLALTESVLISGKGGVHLAGAGVAATLTQSVFLCGTDAVQLDPALVDGRAGMFCALDRCTVAARGAAVRVGDVTSAAVPTEPAVVQTRSCVLMNPFMDAAGRAAHAAGLLRSDGEALARGLLVWQSEDDVYDKRLHFTAAGATTPKQPDAPASWRRVWGSYNVVKPILDVDFRRTVELKADHLDRLALPSGLSFVRPPGADLTRLGVVKKKP